MTEHADPLLDLLSRTATITDRQLASYPLDAERDRLFEQIVSSGVAVEAGRRRRVLVFRPTTALLAAAAVLVFALVVVVVIGQSVVSPVKAKAAGVHFVKHAGYIDATIDDPRAPAASMEAAFAKHGLNITVYVTPASPSLAGTITFMDTPPNFEPIYGPEGSCLLPGGGTRCVIGMRVPADFSGSASIAVNGTPPAGQPYDSTNDALAPGEVLHCSGVRGMTVAQAVPVLWRLGVTPIWRTYDDTDSVDGVSEQSVENQYIESTDPASLGKVMLWVQSEPPSPSAYYNELSRDC